MRREVRRFRGGAAMARYAAGLLGKALRSGRGVFTAALPGGRTPARLFRELARLPLPWERAVLFTSDERLVPLSSPASNFGAARKALFSRIKVPPGNLKPARSAAAWRRDLRAAAGPGGRLDAVFLGLGTDGHTASIFPGSRAWRSRGPVAAVRAPRGVKPSRRLTLTPAAIEKARLVVLLASGPAKRAVFELAAAGDRAVPAGRLRPRGRFYLLFSERD